MDYWGHVQNERIQTLKEHLYGTAEKAGDFAAVFGKRDWGYCAGMLHDIGKYSKEFQEKIHENTEKRVDHSTAGAQVCYQQDGVYGFLSYCIAGHHSGLPDYGHSSDDNNAPTLYARCRKKIPDYHMYKQEIEIPLLSTEPFDLKKAEHESFSLSVFIRMIYSCLVDADFLDTEAFMSEGKVEREKGEDLEVLLKKLINYTSGWMENADRDTVNGRRTEILKHCFSCGEMPQGLFRLTVPTGGGKTIASLAFALQHAVKHQMQRVIYVVPYTSIIEQNAAVFREILGDDNVLEHHCNIDYSVSDELKPMQLASENWDKPIVVTTNVEFFESLFSNRSSRCRKLHNIANSVIIFDEAQMLPNDYLKPCIAMMEELLQRYKASIVLCTATQPTLDSFFSSETKATELCPHMEEQFHFFERVVFHNIGAITGETLTDMLKEEQQALCIVNTKKDAQNLYQKLEGEGVYHLSTTMYPKHRKKILNLIRERLQNGKRCILISTSLVEAGVDLDFVSVYRQVTGVDAVIQAAGRCNREGKRKKEESVVNVFELEGKSTVPGQEQQKGVTEKLLNEEENVFCLSGIKKYFDGLYHIKGETLDKKDILNEFENRRFNFAKVNKEFHLIENDTYTIFIDLEPEAKSLLDQLKYQGYSRKLMRKALQFCVQVYDRDVKIFLEAGIIESFSGEIEDFYVLSYARQYTKEMGLRLEIETGEGLFA